MSIVAHGLSTCDLTPEQNAELQAWLDSIDKGCFSDEAPGDYFDLDWSPDDDEPGLGSATTGGNPPPAP